MRFSLLKPPEDAPSRIPLSRGVPSAEALSVSTSGLPRALPMPTVDADSFAAPYQALARLGASGLAVSSDISNLLLEAEAKKRNADNLAVATNLEYKASLGLDDAIENERVNSDHFTFKSNVNEKWKQISQDTMAQAPNPEVARLLGLKLEGLKAHKYPEVNNIQRTKTGAYYEATLTTAVQAASKMIVDPGTTEVDRDYQIKQVKSLYFGYVQQGLMAPNAALAHEERYLTPTFNILAHQALVADPEKFLPKSEENPDGGEGWKEYGPNGKYPADPKYLATLKDTTGPNLITRRNTERRLESERREARFTDQYTAAWDQRHGQLMDELGSDDPARVAAASVEADRLLRENPMGKFWTREMKDQIRNRLRDTRRAGGITDPATYNNFVSKLLENPKLVSEDEIRSHGGLTLAQTGDRSVQSLILQKRQLEQADDISKRPDYQQGHAQILLLQAGATDMMAIMSTGKAMFAPANIERNRNLYGDALAEFDREARKPVWKDKNLLDLGIQIRKKYMPMVYSDMINAGQTGGSPVTVPKLEGGRP